MACLVVENHWQDYIDAGGPEAGPPVLPPVGTHLYGRHDVTVNAIATLLNLDEEVCRATWQRLLDCGAIVDE